MSMAVVAHGLTKRYGKTTALDGFDLAVPQGTVCGLLGPNGAGKTTAVRILATLLRADSGRAEVAGFDVARQSLEVRYRIGLTGQNPAVDEALSGTENLVMFGRLYHLGKKEARRRAGELLERFNLTESAHRPIKQYSGGMRRRLDLAAGFVMSPPVLFLDEPTTGLDPRHRQEVWESVRALVNEGTTVLLTSHYLDEVDQLADHVTVLDRGRVIADGTPKELKAKVGGNQIDVIVHSREELGAVAEVLRRACDTEPEIDQETRRVSGPVRDIVADLTGVVRGLDDAGITPEDIALRRPTLDEVFMSLTGHKAEEVAA